MGLHNGPQDLTETHQTAGVQMERDDKEVQRGGGDEFTHHGGNQTEPAIMERVIDHMKSLR